MRLLFAVAMCGVLGCYSPSVRDCVVSCESETDCDYGQSCRDGFCTASASCADNPSEPDAVSATSDAMADATMQDLCTVGCPNGTCVDGVCVIDCSAPDSCSGPDIHCQPNLPCKVVCGDRSCDKKIFCDAATSCEVVCSGFDSCSDEVICGLDRPCTVTCSGESSCAKRIKCKDSCSCDASCTGAGSCSETPECPLGLTCRLGAGCSSQLAGCDSCN